MAKQLDHYVPAIKYGAQLNTRVPATGGAAAGKLILVPIFETEQVFLSATSTSQTIFVDDTVSGSYVVAAVEVVFGTASSSGTLQVEVATGTTALGSGTNQLSSTVSLSGTANTAVAGTVIASPTIVSAGSRINVILAGTLTGLANGLANIVLQRVV